MNLTELKVRDFRNSSEETVLFEPGVNLFGVDNNQR